MPSKKTTRNTSLETASQAGPQPADRDPVVVSADRSKPLPVSPPRAGGPFEQDSFASTAFNDVVDRSFHAATARLTGGLSPATLVEAWMDWAIHLASSPGKQMQLAQKAVRKTGTFTSHLANCATHPDGSAPRCI